MKRPDYISVLSRIKPVETADKVLTTPFNIWSQCILHPRTLTGNFNGLAWELSEMDIVLEENKPFSNIVELNKNKLEEIYKRGLHHATELKKVIEDMELHEKHGKKFVCLLVEWPVSSEFDEYFHADGTALYSDFGRTFCVYNGPVTQWARRCDLHKDEAHRNRYHLKPDRQPFQFNNGDIWRHAFHSNGKFWAPPAWYHRRVCGDPEGPPSLKLRGAG